MLKDTWHCWVDTDILPVPVWYFFSCGNQSLLQRTVTRSEEPIKNITLEQKKSVFLLVAALK